MDAVKKNYAKVHAKGLKFLVTKQLESIDLYYYQNEEVDIASQLLCLAALRQSVSL